MTIERFVPPLSRFDSFQKFDALKNQHKFEKVSNKLSKIQAHQKEIILNQESGPMRIHNSPISSSHFTSRVFSPVVPGAHSNSQKNSALIVEDIEKDFNFNSQEENLDIYSDEKDTVSEIFSGIKEPIAILDRNSVRMKIDRQSQVSHYHVENLMSRIDSFHNFGEVKRYFNDIS